MPNPPRPYEMREDVADQVATRASFNWKSGITAICGEARMDG